jgi:hypothetical protein
MLPTFHIPTSFSRYLIGSVHQHFGHPDIDAVAASETVYLGLILITDELDVPTSRLIHLLLGC